MAEVVINLQKYRTLKVNPLVQAHHPRLADDYQLLLARNVIEEPGSIAGYRFRNDFRPDQLSKADIELIREYIAARALLSTQIRMGTYTPPKGAREAAEQTIAAKQSSSPPSAPTAK